MIKLSGKETEAAINFLTAIFRRLNSWLDSLDESIEELKREQKEKDKSDNV